MLTETKNSDNSLKMHGIHLMIECFECDAGILADKDKITLFLEDLPSKIGMRALEKPRIVYYAGNGSWDKGGVTGFVLITESHISIHTFPKEGFFTADVYSCKEFDSSMVVSLFKEYFKSSRERVQVAKRELEFSND